MSTPETRTPSVEEQIATLIHEEEGVGWPGARYLANRIVALLQTREPALLDREPTPEDTAALAWLARMEPSPEVRRHIEHIIDRMGFGRALTGEVAAP